MARGGYQVLTAGYAQLGRRPSSLKPGLILFTSSSLAFVVSPSLLAFATHMGALKLNIGTPLSPKSKAQQKVMTAIRRKRRREDPTTPEESPSPRSKVSLTSSSFRESRCYAAC